MELFSATWGLAFLAVFAVSLISFVGAFTLAMSTKTLKKILPVLVAIAAGTLIGDALLHLLPHHAEEFGFSVWTGLWILLGMSAILVIERVIHWHHCHSPTHNHVKPFGWGLLAGDAVHNFLDGALIAASFLVNPAVGLATTIAVALHEIPQEIADFGVLVHAGFSKTKALVVNFASGLVALVGAVVVFFASERFEAIEQVLVPFTAGAFLYIAIADLLPELREETRTKHALFHAGAFIIGLALMALLLLFEA